MNVFACIVAVTMVLLAVDPASATGILAVRQRVVVQQVKVQQVKVQQVKVQQVKVQQVVAVHHAAIYAPVQTLIAAPYVAQTYYAQPAPVRAERIIEKYESGKLIERIVEK